MPDSNTIAVVLSEFQKERLGLMGAFDDDAIEHHINQALDVYLANRMHRISAPIGSVMGNLSLLLGATRSGKTALACHQVNTDITYGRNVIVIGRQDLVTKAIQSACEVRREECVHINSIAHNIDESFIFVYPVDVHTEKTKVIDFWTSDKGYVLLEKLLSHVQQSVHGTTICIDDCMVAGLKQMLAFFVDMATRVEDVKLLITGESIGQIDQTFPNEQALTFINQFDAILALRCADVPTAEKLSALFAENRFEVSTESLINQEPNSLYALLLPNGDRDEAECETLTFDPPPYSHLELQRINGVDHDIPMFVVASVPKMMRRLIGNLE